ncbi:long-chain fatty acid--CoA ligase [Corynebacterium xerosis]|uniref:Acyl-CoA synthetase n=2 Tax=Corynebacterium TaxID=1716 RepID=A0A0M2X3W3_9CORY|nr:long-chain fatty acid--CoA ligase [Corynebacterium xerosis]KKO76759.1 long-chain fatty acid--CoA ligase [Corynebacterium xerosis]NMF10258.1 long-chain fatty acid--CoA ligase [Corynebacterium xerosis]
MREYSTEAQYAVGEKETVVTAMQELVAKRPKLVMFTRPKNFEWVNVTAQEFHDEAFAVAKGLIANGVQKGDRVALLSETRYEWNLINIAIWMAGATIVPIYGSSSAGQIRWIIEDSGAVFAITEGRQHTERMKNLIIDDSGHAPLSESPTQLRRVLEINAAAVDTLMYEGRDIDDAEVQDRIDASTSADLASVIYTSGTTGRPKGCMLDHSNWLSEVRAILTNDIGVIARPGNRILTFLPLAHVLANAVSLASIVGGATQSHWADTTTVTLEFQRSRPHLILGVPRVFEKVRDSAQAGAKEKGAFGMALFERAEAAAIEYSKALDTPAGPSTAQKLRLKMYDKLLFAKIKAAMGEAVQYTISGGSALSSDLGHFFRGLGVTVYEGYGLTESTAAITVNTPTDQVIGTVGRPVGGCSVKIADDGEILLKGPVVFKGYWQNDEATEKTFDGEWFKTGDLGELDDTGHLRVTGRKKDLIVTAGGKNVSPGPMEDRMRSHPLVSQAVVIGDGRPFISVLITLDEEAVGKWKAEHNVPEQTTVRELAANAVLRAEIQDAVNAANELVSHAEAIKKFHILPRDLSEEEGEMTPTMKVKRNIVVDKFAREVEDMYHR